MTTRELGLLARHIIQTYPEYYSIYYGQRDFTWNKIKQPNRNPLLSLEIGADGLKTGYTKKRLRPGRLGGAERHPPRLPWSMAQNAEKNAPRMAASCSSGVQEFRAPHCCSPKARSSAPPRCSAVRPAPCRWWHRSRPGHDRRKRAATHRGPHCLSGTGTGTDREGQGDRELRVWRNDKVILNMPLEGRGKRRARSLSNGRFVAAAELMIGLFRPVRKSYDERGRFITFEGGEAPASPRMRPNSLNV